MDFQAIYQSKLTTPEEAVKAVTIVDQTVSFAYGIAHSSEGYKDMEGMLHSADSSMYDMKQKMKG